MAKEKLNGSVDTIARAMRAVFTEAVEGAVESLNNAAGEMRTEVAEIRTDMGKWKAV